MGGSFNISYIYQAIDKFTPVAKKLNRLLNHQKKRFRQITDVINKHKFAMIAAMTAITGALTGAVIASASFEKGLANVFTLLDKPTLKKFRKELTGVSERAVMAGFGIEDANKALFDTISAGVEAGKASEFFAVSQKLAIGGVTDLGVAVDGMTSIMNAYGKENFDATKTANAFFTAQKFGKTTVAELAQNIGQIAPIGKTAGVSFNELSAALATLTLSGLRTDLATTALKNVMIGLVKPSEALRPLFEHLKIPFGAVELKSKGLGFALERINEAYKKNADLLAVIFPNIRAFLGAAGLSEEALKKYGIILDAVTNDTESLNLAFIEQSSTLTQMGKQMSGIIKVLGKSFGDELAPAVKIASSLIGKFGLFLFNLSPTTKKIILIVSLLTVGILGLIVAIPTLIAALTILGFAFSVTWASALGPIALIALGIIGLIALGKVLYDKWLPFKILVDAIVIGIKELFDVIKKNLALISKLAFLIPGLQSIASSFGAASTAIETKGMNDSTLAGTKSTLDAKIAISAPKGTVKSFQTNQRAGRGVNLGFAMEEIYGTF